MTARFRLAHRTISVRTCVPLCHQADSELEQIQFLLGHVPVQMTERYLNCKQRFRKTVNDRIGPRPDG
jgi:hypothetical protein